MKKRLVLFDFDGTITTKDTFIEFIRFYHGSLRFMAGFALLSPVLVAYKLKLLANWKAKEKVLTWFFKNEPLDTFTLKCDEFTVSVLPNLIRPKALEAIHEMEKDYDIVVVSASAENWVSPWCRANNLHIIGTTLEVVDGRLTGKIKGKNCFGIEKVNRIKEKYDLVSYTEILAYGDSSGDKEMFELAHKHFYKPFRR
jgi:phosphatidylglycerophosphatase C